MGAASCATTKTRRWRCCWSFGLRSGWFFVDGGAANGGEYHADEQDQADSDREASRNYVGSDTIGVGKRVREEPVGSAGEGRRLGTRAKARPRCRVEPHHANSSHEGRNNEERNGAGAHLTIEGFHEPVPLGSIDNAVQDVFEDVYDQTSHQATENHACQIDFSHRNPPRVV